MAERGLSAGSCAVGQITEWLEHVCAIAPQGAVKDKWQNFYCICNGYKLWDGMSTWQFSIFIEWFTFDTLVAGINLEHLSSHCHVHGFTIWAYHEHSELFSYAALAKYLAILHVVQKRISENFPKFSNENRIDCFWLTLVKISPHINAYMIINNLWNTLLGLVAWNIAATSKQKEQVKDLFHAFRCLWVYGS